MATSISAAVDEANRERERIQAVGDTTEPRMMTARGDDLDPPKVTHSTLAAWRSELARLRGEERRTGTLTPETGRLLEIVGQVLAQGGGALPPDDIARIEALTLVDATYS